MRLAVPFKAESLVVVVHLESDWPPQAPVDVEQPLEDEHAVFLHTRGDRQQSSGSQGRDILLAGCHGDSVSGVRAGPGAHSSHEAETF